MLVRIVFPQPNSFQVSNSFLTHRFFHIILHCGVSFSCFSVINMLRLNMLVKCLAIFLVTISSASRLKRNNDVCGVPTQSSSLVVNGVDFQRGTWPWMVPLMDRTTSPPKLFCGAVLVSKTKVITGKIKLERARVTVNNSSFSSSRALYPGEKSTDS